MLPAHTVDHCSQRIMTPFASILSLCLLLSSAAKAQGQDSSEGDTLRIANGEDTLTLQKYLVSIQSITFSGALAHMCAGVIVDVNMVLTTAACVNGFNPAELSILAGVDDLRSTLGSRHTVFDYMVMGISSRKQYLAVVRVEPPFIIGPRIAIKPIPAVTTTTVVGDVVILYGYGRVDPTEFLRPNKLQYLLTKVVSNAVCANSYVSYPFTGANEICTYVSPGRGVCKGDAGGPVLLIDTKELVGIIATGGRICGGGSPDISLNVPANADWITRAIAALNMQTAPAAPI